MTSLATALTAAATLCRFPASSVAIATSSIGAALAGPRVNPSLAARCIHNTAVSASSAGRWAQGRPSSLPPAGSGAAPKLGFAPAALGAGDPGPGQAFFRTRWPYLTALGLAASGALAYTVFREPVVTQRVYLDFEVAGRPAGRVVVGLYGKEAPQTCDNFAALTSHERGFGYRGCAVHRVMHGWSVWSGDVTAGDGTGGVSVFGPSIGVETMSVRHRRGAVSMVLDEEGRIRSQFFFTLVTTPALDRKAAAFGRVLEGIEVLDRLSRLPTAAPAGQQQGAGQLAAAQGPGSEGRPLVEVRVSDCGLVPEGEQGQGQRAA
ncbi:hypothetical protein Agub_g11700 [Astrephomene gubernaculifera]|uniref:PPIase cyclophilin-type domain-containing protein n=1 Tax=Astrephomene gubernaculifera TaxID=47775 RepID=A0AAD3DZR1_9CHLO|nr:hypothetical protein Agub_g11700 [Astrephomene gubernaculifera]